MGDAAVWLYEDDCYCEPCYAEALAVEGEGLAAQVTWTTASASAHTMAGKDGGQVVLVAEARGACMTHTHTHATISPHGRNLIPSGGRSWRSNLAARCPQAVLITQQTCPRPNTQCASPTRRDHCSGITVQRDHFFDLRFVSMSGASAYGRS